VKRKIAVVVGLLLTIGVGSAVFLWPTPQRNAIARVQELQGIYREERDSTGRKVVSVIFIGRPIKNDDLSTLRDIRPLNRVFLDSTKVTDAGLAYLEGIEGLEWVSVGDTAVTDEGMVHLSKIPTLHTLHLRKTRVTDAGLAHLQGLPNLTYVTVGQTKITQAGIDALRRTTPSLKSASLDTEDGD